MTSLRWFIDCVLIHAAVRWAVPVFVMISGFLLLDPDKEVGLQKLKRYVLRMAAVLCTFGFVYCVIETVMDRGLTGLPMSILLSAKNLVEGKSWAHMWYVYMLIGLYLLTPVLRAFTKGADQKEMSLVLTALFVLTVVRPTINTIFSTDLEGFIPISSPYIFYYLMGCYVHKYGISKRLSWAGLTLGLVGIVLTGLGEIIGIIIESFPNNLFVSIYSISIFSLAKNNMALEKQARSKMIMSISKYSFGIYLIHPFFLNLLNKGFDIFPGSMPTGVGEIVFFVYAFVGAYIGAWLLSYIAIFRNMLR